MNSYSRQQQPRDGDALEQTCVGDILATFNLDGKWKVFYNSVLVEYLEKQNSQSESVKEIQSVSIPYYFFECLFLFCRLLLG